MEGGFKYVPVNSCEKIETGLFYTNGLFTGGKSLKRVGPFNIFRLILVFLVSQTLRYVFRPLKLTHYVCNMLAGIMVGASLLGLSTEYRHIKEKPSQIQFLNLMSALGLIYHIFLVNVKIDCKRILKTGRKVRTIGVSVPFCAFVVMAILNAIFHPLSFKVHSDEYKFVFASACNSVVNVVPLLEELHLLTTELGQVSLSAAIISDIMSSLFWLGSILRTSFIKGFFKAAIPLSVVILFIFGVMRPFMQWIIRRTPHGKPVSDFYVIAILLMLAIIAALFDVIAGNPLLGVMMFGLVVPNGPPLGSAVVETADLLIHNFFLPFFYLSIGDMINLHTFKDFKGHLKFQLIVIAGYFTRTLAATILAMMYNMSYRQSLSLGFLMNAAGVSDNAFTWFSRMRQRSDAAVGTLLVLASIGKGIVVTPLSLCFCKHTCRMDESIRGFDLSIQATQTNSRMRILACVDSVEDVTGVVTLLEASNPTELNPIYTYVVHLNELIGEAVPVLTPHRKHRRICNHNGCLQIWCGLKSYTDDSEGRIALQLLTMIAPFKSMHEGLCRLAQDKMIPLMIVPFTYKSPAQYRQRTISSDLNRKIQAQAPCTVGILVDGPRHRRDQKYFTYKIVVLFFGGEDDREVLAYATRMSGHPAVSILMLRIEVETHQLEGESDDNERYLDDSLVEEFRTKITDNACAVYREVQVENWVQAVQVVKSVNSENEYDLVMVGRRHGDSATHEELSGLGETQELGFIGEMLYFSSEGNHKRTFSILVMQHSMGVDRDALDNLMFMEDEDA